jgi:ABC-type glycerol-3-phosphate transport system substrate-binding protein
MLKSKSKRLGLVLVTALGLVGCQSSADPPTVTTITTVHSTEMDPPPIPAPPADDQK